MLSVRAWVALCQVMSIGCHLKFFPYKWDHVKGRLTAEISRTHNFIFNVHGYVQLIMLIFCLIRLVLGLGDVTMPPRIRVMNLLWILAYIHGLQGFIELKYKRNDILCISNLVLAYIERNLHKSMPKSGNKKKTDWVSILVILSNFLLLTSPAIHGVMLLGSPCAVHFSSSLYLDCKNAGHNIGTMLEKFPFFLLENYFVAVFFFFLAFNWFIVFLGLGWVRIELQGLSTILERGNGEEDFGQLDLIPEKYRFIQCLQTLLNESFRLYLSWAPMIFMAHVSLLLFASFRYWDEDFISYIMFPACGARCMLDAVTPLALAGDLSAECQKVHENWKQSIGSKVKDSACGNMVLERKWHRMFQLSCKEISCKAGSMYKMEKAILPVNMNNMSLITLNMLIGIPHKAREVA